MSDVNAEVRARIEAFSGELAELIRRAALEAVQEVLGSGAAPSPPATHARAAAKGRPSKRAVRGRPRSVATAPRGSAGKKRAPGEKRSADELAKLTDKLATYIKANPGQRIEQIGAGLGRPTKELSLPVKKLLRAKRISSKGHKRATTYHPLNKGLVQVRKGRKGAEGASQGTSG
jgi:hypothetical protein